MVVGIALGPSGSQAHIPKHMASRAGTRGDGSQVKWTEPPAWPGEIPLESHLHQHLPSELGQVTPCLSFIICPGTGR